MTPILLLALGCSTPPIPPDLVLVTLDTTRADRIGAYGYDRAHTPNLDALAARGRRYERAYSPVPLTIPAHASLFTGKMPHRLGIRGNGDGLLSAGENTLAELLHRQGYATAGSIAAFVTTRVWGFEQGFDAYFDDIAQTERNFWSAERSADLVIDDALAWYDDQATGKPRFLWVHLYDVHTPWVIHDPAYEKRPYDGELAYVDAQLGRLIQATADRPTLFVVVGDHGEGLGDHIEIEHGLFVYENTQRVPWIMAGPGIDAGEVVTEPVALHDVLPTALYALGMDPPKGIDGAVVPTGTPRGLFLEAHTLTSRLGLAPHVAYVEDQYKLIDTPRPELYDLSADPHEKTDIAADHPEEVARMQAALAALAVPPPGETSGADPATKAQLAALGYVDGGFKGDTSGPLPDPKDHRSVLVRSQKAKRLDRQGKHAEAEAILATLVEERPEATEFATRHANLLARMGRDEEAAAELEGLLAADPDNLAFKQSVASLRARQGRFEEAATLFAEVAQAMPFAPRVRTMAVAALVTSPATVQRGMELAERYLQEFPDDHRVAGVLGVVQARNNVPGADRMLARGMMANPPETGVAYHLGRLEQEVGHLDRAEERYRTEIAHHPELPDVWLALVALLSQQQRWDAVVAASAQAIDAQGHDLALLWHARAQAQFNAADLSGARATLDVALPKHPAHPALLLLDANLLRKEGKEEAALARRAEAEAAHAASLPR